MRVPCPWCKKVVQLLKAGTLREHWEPGAIKGRHESCRGSGKPLAEVEQLNAEFERAVNEPTQHEKTTLCLAMDLIDALQLFLTHNLDPGSYGRALLAGFYDEAEQRAHPLLRPHHADHVRYVERYIPSEKRVFTCPDCARVSYNRIDLLHWFCGACEEFK